MNFKVVLLVIALVGIVTCDPECPRVAIDAKVQASLKCNTTTGSATCANKGCDHPCSKEFARHSDEEFDACVHLSPKSREALKLAVLPCRPCSVAAAMRFVSGAAATVMACVIFSIM